MLDYNPLEVKLVKSTKPIEKAYREFAKKNGLGEVNFNIGNREDTSLSNSSIYRIALRAVEYYKCKDLDDSHLEKDALYNLFETNEDLIVENGFHPDIFAETLKQILNVKVSVKSLSTAISYALENYDDENVRKVDYFFDLYVHFLEYIETKDNPILTTPLKTWNLVLGGGLTSPGLHILAAGSGKGKSALALQIACEAALQDKFVMYYNLEMSNIQVVSRVLSMLDASLNSSALLAKKVNHVEKQKLYKIDDIISDFPLFISTSKYIDKIISEIENKIQTYRKPDLIIIDYLQLIESSFSLNSTASTEFVVSQVTKRLKNLINKHDLRVLALAQKNEKESKNLGIGNLRSSAAIGHFAETISFINHEPILDEAGNLIDEMAKIEVVKNRNFSSQNLPTILLDMKHFRNTGIFREEETHREKEESNNRNKAQDNTKTNFGKSVREPVSSGSSKNALPQLPISRF